MFFNLHPDNYNRVKQYIVIILIIIWSIYKWTITIKKNMKKTEILNLTEISIETTNMNVPYLMLMCLCVAK